MSDPEVDPGLATVLPHLTFSVGAIKGSGSVLADELRLITLNRWQQLQAPSLAGLDLTGLPPCSEDNVRPSAPGTTFSVAVGERRDYGRDQKLRQFYTSQLDEVGDATLSAVVSQQGFSQHFVDLARRDDDSVLAGKMAVLYADGNAFGNWRAMACAANPTDPTAALRSFDAALSGQQQGFLQQLLTEATDVAKPDWREHGGAGRIRLETLLWGGDEIMIAVPAWCGWRALERFLAQPRMLTLAGISHELTFGIGLVFCHHNAPIRRVTALAHDLCEIAKDDRTRSRVAYEVLESFDHLGKDPRAARARRAGSLAAALVLEKRHLAAIAAATALGGGDLARGRLYELIGTLRAGGNGAAIEQRLVRDLRPDDLARVEQLKGAFTPPETAWLHLAELWDYLPDGATR